MKTLHLSKSSSLIVLASLSALITGAIFFFEEGRHNFMFMTTGEISNFLIFFILVSITPISIYFLTKESKYARRSIYIALAGYIPALLLLLKML